MDSVLSEILKMALIAALPAGFALMGAFFNWLRVWVEAKTRSEWLLIIEREAFEVVSAIAQTVAEPIKQAAADGKLTDEEKQRIKQLALDALKLRLTSIPLHLFPDLSVRLGEAIEAKINQSKGA